MTKLALITGGQTGIGLGIAKALVGQGWQVAIASLPTCDAKDVRQALGALGDAARYYQHDLRANPAIETLLDRVEAEQGLVTSLISNAGVPARVRGDMLDILPENFDFAMDINLRGGFFLAQAVARRFVTRGGAGDEYRSLVFITSASAGMVSVERAEYCISKAAAGMMAQLYAARLAREGIGVFEVRPGIIKTGMTAGVQDQYTARINDGLVPARRWGLPDDVGQAVVPLVTGQMEFANGAVIPVDGGLSIHRL